MAKRKEDEKAETRLTEISVSEVSLVDRAANRRRFLLTKSEDSSMAKQLVADGKGGFEEVDVDKTDGGTTGDGTNTTDAGSTDVDKGKTEGKGADGDDDANKAKKPGCKEDEAKKQKTEKSVAMLGAIAQRVLDVAKSVKESGEEIPETFEAEVASMLSEVAKAGRMTPKRKADFKAALDKLAALLKEISDEGDDGDGAAKTNAKKSADGANLEAGNNEEIAALKKSVDDLVATVAKQDETIRQLREQPAGSNALPVDKSEGSSGGSSDDTVWPLDMNAEAKISKAAAEKRGVSFYDPD